MAEEAPPGVDAAASSFADDVGASVIVEAGATSGTLTLPASAMKFADLTESGSESGDNEAGSGSGSGEPGTSAAATGGQPSSPPPNCAICLSRCHRKCFTDSCMHQFCFKCLCEWSKIKAECPLCKQRFKTIIHNVRTLDDYDRYPVQTSSPSQPDHPAMRFHIVRRPRFMPLVQNQAVMTNDIEAGIGAGGGAAAGVLAAEEVLPAVDTSGRHSYNRFEPYRWELLNFYRNDQDAATAGSSSLIQLWRRYVYDRKLYALPVSDSLTGHFREWSARFYRNNPSQMHRLMPWIQRDIVCLLRNAAHSVRTVMQLMHNILPMTNILGPTFRRHLSPFLGNRTSHFIHELFNFARSPFDMIGYDHVVQYSARVAEEVEVDLLDMVETQSSNDGDLHLEVGVSVDGEVANAEASSNEWSTANGGGGGGGTGAGGRPSTSVIVTNPSATHSFSVSMAADGSELPGISIRRTATTSNVGSQTVAINLSMRRPATAGGGDSVDAGEIIEIDDGDAAANAEVAAINDGSNPSRRHAGATLPVSAHIELQSSSSSSSDEEDECVFVLELKPPHLRTPEQVSLDSNSDSDVVFVDEQNNAAAAPSTTADNPEAQAAMDQAILSPGDQSSHHLFMGPSTSAAATRGKNWKLVMAEAQRQDQIRTTRSSRSKRSRQRRSLVPARYASSNSSSNSSSSFGWSTSSDEGSSSESSSFNPSASTKKRQRKTMATRKAAGKSPRRKGKSLKRGRRQAEVPEQEASTPVEAAPPAAMEQQEDTEQQQQQQQQTSSDSCSSCADESAAESSGSSGPHVPDRIKDNSSSDDSDDDSTENLQLSALRATLKAEATLEDRKPLKLELHEDDDDEDEEEQQQQEPPQTPQPQKDEEDEEQQQEQEQSPQSPEETKPQALHSTPPEDTEPSGCSAPKRRRRCSNQSDLSSHSASLASSSTTSTTSSGPLSSFNWRAASYGSDPLMREVLALEDDDDMAPALVDVALNFLRQDGHHEEAEVETAEDTATADEDEEEDAEENAEEEENAEDDTDLAENTNYNNNDDEEEEDEDSL